MRESPAGTRCGAAGGGRFRRRGFRAVSSLACGIHGRHGAARRDLAREVHTVMIAATGACSWSGLFDLMPTIRWYVTRRCGNDAEVDDVLQETLLRAARYRASLADQARLRPWVLRIAVNVLHDRARSEARLPRTDVDADVFDALEGREAIPGELVDEAGVAVEDDLVGRGYLARHLRGALDELRDLDRQLLIGRYSSRDDARRLRPSGPNKVRLYRARRRLISALRARIARDPDRERAACVVTFPQDLPRPARRGPGRLPVECGAVCAAETTP